MRFEGPRIMKTVHVPAHDIEIFDEDAYWHLDYFGQPDPEKQGMWLFAKVAWPTLAAAMEQARTIDLAWKQQREVAQDRTRQAQRERRAARKQKKEVTT